MSSIATRHSAVLLLVATSVAVACARTGPTHAPRVVVSLLPSASVVASVDPPEELPADAPVASDSPPPSRGEELDHPPAAIGPLVPWMPASAWQGRGVPPKQFSIFAIPESSPVLGYAALDRDACEDVLRRRGVPFARAEDTAGVRAPIRLTGPLHGVTIHSSLPGADRARSRAELIDCRLAVSLDDLAQSLDARGIVEMTHISAYRSKKEGGCTAKYAGEQHCAALALDVASFTRKDGTKLVVQRDFHGKVGLLTCAEKPRNELWEIACAAAGKQFQVVLTPNWNEQHQNHLHLELTVHDWVLAR